MGQSQSCLQIHLLEILLVHWPPKHFLNLGFQNQRLHQVGHQQILRLQILRQVSLHQLAFQHWVSHPRKRPLASR